MVRHYTDEQRWEDIIKMRRDGKIIIKDEQRW